MQGMKKSHRKKRKAQESGFEHTKFNEDEWAKCQKKMKFYR